MLPTCPTEPAVKSKPQQGFTLLEMLVVMVLLGLITSLALPAMQRWHDAVQLRAQAGLVVDVLRAAAFQAAASRRDMVVDASSFEERSPALSAPPSASAPASSQADAEAAIPADGVARAPAARQDHVTVTLASGWSVTEVTAARFLSTGLCDSGGFTLQPPAGTPVAVRVDGPVCKIALLSPADTR